ncbi:transcription cofactor vestigial-like protein 1 [Myxocyprinus asiaticus]|uniref:transcription cofactor vestigial-like protein 1 n=1 Tax=Myxocyprinus asiaticus TaxID=70543 RepID=UPI002221D189|nr:transcription cofactor vestigial-like protein 1 [Myxocyprinus asiaticus]
MEEDLESPVARKTEEQSGSVLLTYFQGDIGSMVDEHFSRALSNTTKQKGERSKSQRICKSAQKSRLGTNQWETQSHTGIPSMFPPEWLQLKTNNEPQLNTHMPLNHPANSGILWSGGSRQGMSLALPTMVYPSVGSTDGLVVAEYQYTHSLLNLLNNDRPDLGTVVVAPSKQDHISGWTKDPGFRD